MADISESLTTKERFKYLFKFHWRGVIQFLTPIFFLPILFFEPAKPMRCLYIFNVMMTYWITEAARPYITGLIPIVAMPVMGIMSSEETCMEYLSNFVLFFVLSMMISLTIEYNNLHTRIALAILAAIGYRPRILHLGIMLLTALTSTILANTMVMALMCPVVKAILLEFEEQGAVQIYKDTEINGESDRPYPTKLTISFFIGVAYASNIGGCVSLLANPANMAFKESYKRRFETDNRYKIEFEDFVYFNVLPTILIFAFTYIWLEIVYMGLFRPQSKAAKDLKIDAERKTVINKSMKIKFKDLGLISLAELFVGLYVVLGIMALIIISTLVHSFRFYPKKWENLNVLKIKNSTPVVGTIFLLLITPGALHYFPCFWYRKPKENSRGKSLIVWDHLQENLRWDTMLMLGGLFALTKGLYESRLFIVISRNIMILKDLPRPAALYFCSLFGLLFSAFCSTSPTINMVLPFVYDLAYMVKAHPLYLGLPVAMCINLSFHFPMSTPVNAVAADYGNIRMWDMALAGIGPSIITLIIYPTFGHFLGPIIFKGIDIFPDWAKTDSENLN